METLSTSSDSLLSRRLQAVRRNWKVKTIVLSSIIIVILIIIITVSVSLSVSHAKNDGIVQNLADVNVTTLSPATESSTTTTISTTERTSSTIPTTKDRKRKTSTVPPKLPTETNWTDIPLEQSINFVIPCLRNVSKDVCIKKGCTWRSNKDKILCQLPKKTFVYNVASVLRRQSDGSFSVLLDRTVDNSISMFDNDIKMVKFEVFMFNDTALRFKFTDATKRRYEVPLELNEAGGTKYYHKGKNLYDVRLINETIGSPFGFQVIRKRTKTILWDTGVGGFFFEDQFLQMVTILPSNSLRGFGENSHNSTFLDMNYKTYPIFSRNQQSLDRYLNLNGAHPFYMCTEKDFYSHGVFMMNSNAMDYTTLPDSGLMLRTTGGILDFFMFLGPTPELIIQQYTHLIGKPHLPPYWSLGFHADFRGITNMETIRDVIYTMELTHIPMDVIHLDAKVASIKDVHSSKSNLFHFRKNEIKAMNLKVITNISPRVNAQPKIFKGKGWSNSEFFVQMYTGQEQESNVTSNLLCPMHKGNFTFMNPFRNGTMGFWKSRLYSFHKMAHFDGLYLEKNQPLCLREDAANQLNCPVNRYDDPPYNPTMHVSPRLSDKTICMNSIHVDGQNVMKHYDVHNIYGLSHAKATFMGMKSFLEDKHPFMISESTFPSSGKWSAHLLSTNVKSWFDLKRAIIGIVEFNLFGIPQVGPTICGGRSSKNLELCVSLMQVGAFFPLSRNNIAGILPLKQLKGLSEFVNVLKLRYSLLQYLHSLFYEAHLYGSTVIRTLFHEFTTEEFTKIENDIFLWGSSLMIVPRLHRNVKTRDIVTVFDQTEWYSYPEGVKQKHGKVEFKDYSYVRLFMRSGSIIASQQAGITTDDNRHTRNYTLTIAPSYNGAYGTLFLDYGDSTDSKKADHMFVDFSYKKCKLKITITETAFGMVKGDRFITDVIVYNTEEEPNGKLKFGRSFSVVETHNFTYDDKHVLHWKGLEIGLTNVFVFRTVHHISWNRKDGKPCTK